VVVALELRPEAREGQVIKLFDQQEFELSVGDERQHLRLMGEFRAFVDRLRAGYL
jgi:hypothetical protein